MAKTKPTGLRKSLEILIKRVEALENQCFGQKLLIDELDGKLQRAEEHINKLKEDPFTIASWPLPPAAPYSSAPYSPPVHYCTPGTTDWTGSTYCSSCGAHMYGPSWTVTSTSDGTSLCLADPTVQSSADVEPMLDIDITWTLPEDTTKKG
jgi:hypothetical protein